MANIVIRPATALDAEVLIAILYNTFDSTWRPHITVAAANQFRAERRPEAFVAESSHEFLVAERGGAVVGLVHRLKDHITALHVHSDHARTGVGARLMDWVETEAAAAGLKAIHLETDTFNQASQAFYAARRYRETDRYPDKEWHSDVTTILLEKTLAAT